jgi:uncharacterized protein YbaA (DUF1428 family)
VRSSVGSGGNTISVALLPPYPDKATRDAANEKMSADPEAMQMEMPFDGQRMFWGGFQPVLHE